MDFALRSDPLEILTLSILHALCVWQKVWVSHRKNNSKKTNNRGKHGGEGLGFYFTFFLWAKLKLVKCYRCSISKFNWVNFMNDCQILCLQAVLLVEQDKTQLPDVFLNER